jgi:hypothetical protein
MSSQSGHAGADNKGPAGTASCMSRAGTPPLQVGYWRAVRALPEARRPSPRAEMTRLRTLCHAARSLSMRSANHAHAPVPMAILARRARAA